MFKKTTDGITVTVMPVYIDERSNPRNSEYFWAYRVIVENNSHQKVQLLSRYWKIIDAEGHVEVVEGEGVIGLQPVIPPGKDFGYTSGCPLRCPSGIMEGYYQMQGDNGEQFRILIPAFPLDLPDIDPVIN